MDKITIEDKLMLKLIETRSQERRNEWDRVGEIYAPNSFE